MGQNQNNPTFATENIKQMITKEQLNNIGFHSTDNTEYYDWGNWSVMFNIKTQTLYEHCEVNGVGEILTKVTNIQKLIDIYSSMFGNEFFDEE